ncbi:glycosyltransferase [Nocardioides convexus]|uniref:glycosyltransferase n=1 Tax=Nocardioides convexus TaxID=2712224 RepID=UPI002418B27E|nr:glycosyltransferase [Nocardioides convexus]
MTSRYAEEEFRTVAANAGCPVERVPLGVDLETFRPVPRAPRGREPAAGPRRTALAGEVPAPRRRHGGRACTGAAYRCGWTSTATARTATSLEEIAAGAPVTFHGYVDGREVLRDRLAAADVSLSVCPGETFGLAVLEALACGTPVVTADRGGARELVDAASGEWATPDASALADAVLRLAARPEEDVRRGARQRAERFGWDRTVARMLALHAGERVGVLTA